MEINSKPEAVFLVKQPFQYGRKWQNVYFSMVKN